MEAIVDDEVVAAMPDRVVIPAARVLGLCEARSARTRSRCAPVDWPASAATWTTTTSSPTSWPPAVTRSPQPPGTRSGSAGWTATPTT
ncbi:hypothetical protein NKH18_42320 [Streptomyces sp. M10(2022)]